LPSTLDYFANNFLVDIRQSKYKITEN